VPASELKASDDLYKRYGAALSRSLGTRLNRICPGRAISQTRSSLPSRKNHRLDLTVAIAQDEAFSFYYPETIDRLNSTCRNVILFSPLADHEPPPADLVYLGGGFPEVFAEKLSANTVLRQSLRRLLLSGLPAYAECGGLMYLASQIVTTGGTSFPMLDVLPGRCVMHSRRQALGYWRARITRPVLFLRKNQSIVGHEYHWSTFEPDRRLKSFYLARKIGAAEKHPGGWQTHHVLASYLHLSALGNPNFFHALLSWADRIKQSGPGRISASGAPSAGVSDAGRPLRSVSPAAAGLDRTPQSPPSVVAHRHA